MEMGTAYYWRIDEVNGPNTWQGMLWNFTTSFYSLMGDMDGDCWVDWYDYGLFTLNWGATDCCEPDWCGSDLDYSGEVNFVDLEILTYEWLRFDPECLK